MVKVLGREHPNTQTVLQNLILCYVVQEKMAEVAWIMEQYPEIILSLLQNESP